MAAPTALFQFRVPTTSTNYALNPSAEAGSASTPSNATATGSATITRVSTYSRQVTPDSQYAYRVQTSGSNAGLRLTTASLPNAATYVSCWVRGTFTAANIRFVINGTTVTPTLYETDGGWSWFVNEAAAFAGATVSGQTTVDILHTTTGADCYVDDVVVQQTTWTTTFHGSYPGCRWTGIAHQSTSTLAPRAADGGPNLAAGRIYDFDNRTTLAVSSALGLGLPDIELLTTETADVGKVLQTARLGARQMVLSSTRVNTTLATYHSGRAALLSYIAPGERFVFRYRGNAVWNSGTADVQEIEASYVKGMEGALAKFSVDETAVTLTAFDPRFRPATETATTLTMATTGTISYAMKRSQGEWTFPGDPTSFLYALACSPKGHLYAGARYGGKDLRGWDGTSWSSVGTMTIAGDDPKVYALAFDPSGTVLYVGGEFTTMDGVTCNNIAKYTLPSAGVAGGTWAALGGTPGVNGQVNAIVTAPTATGHDVYVFGQFTTAGGSSANYAAKWNGSAWSTLGPNTASASGYIQAATYSPDGYIYVGGNFTTLGTISTPGAPSLSLISGSLTGAYTYAVSAITGDSNGEYGETVTGSTATANPSGQGVRVTWSGVTGATGYWVYRSQPSGGGTVYRLVYVASGTTTYDDTGAVTLSGTSPLSTATDGTRSSPRVGKYNIAKNAFVRVGQSGINGSVYALALAPDAVTLYAGGSFTTADGTTVSNIAQYNGQVWTAMGDGVSGGAVRALLVMPGGELMVGGAFTSAGPSLVGALATSLAMWIPDLTTGSGTWTHTSLGFPSSTTVYSLITDHNGDLWVGFDTTGSATYAAGTTVTTAGGGGAFLSYPRIYVQGPGTLKYLANATLNQRVWLNLPVATDEVITLDLRPGYKTVTSSVGGASRLGYVVAGELGDLGLTNGSNRLVALFTGTSGNATIKVADPALRLSAD